MPLHQLTVDVPSYIRSVRAFVLYGVMQEHPAVECCPAQMRLRNVRYKTRPLYNLSLQVLAVGLIA